MLSVSKSDITAFGGACVVVWVFCVKLLLGFLCSLSSNLLPFVFSPQCVVKGVADFSLLPKWQLRQT